MSQTEQFKWTATLIKKIDWEITMEDVAKRICDENGWRLENFYKSYTQALISEGYKQYVVDDDNGNIYEVDYNEYEDDEDIFESSKNEDGTISFHIKYYNWWCSFSEAVTEAINNI